MEFNQELDVRGLKCPLPILRSKKALATMQSGEVLRVIATDPGAAKDFPAFAKQTGNDLIDDEAQDNGEFVFFLRRK